MSASLFGPAIDPAQTKLFGVLNVNIPSFGVFLQLLQTNNDVNVISKPILRRAVSAEKLVTRWARGA